jgi:hypothetical protein
MKKLLLTVGLVVAALCAQAQVQTLLSGYKIPAAGLTNFPTGLTIDCRGQQNVGLSLQVDGGGTNIAFFQFYAYVDNATNTPTLASLPAGGSFVVWAHAQSVTAVEGRSVAYTNLAVQGIPYLRLTWATNAGVAMTNVTMKYWVKKNAP